MHAHPNLTLRIANGISWQNLSGCDPSTVKLAERKADIQAFNGGTSLGSFREDGLSGPEGNNSAIFIGLKDLDGANVTSIVFSVTAAVLDPMDFAINKLSLDSGEVVSKPKCNSEASGISLD